MVTSAMGEADAEKAERRRSRGTRLSARGAASQISRP